MTLFVTHENKKSRKEHGRKKTQCDAFQLSTKGPFKQNVSTECSSAVNSNANILTPVGMITVDNLHHNGLTTNEK